MIASFEISVILENEVHIYWTSILVKTVKPKHYQQYESNFIQIRILLFFTLKFLYSKYIDFIKILNFLFENLKARRDVLSSNCK